MMVRVYGGPSATQFLLELLVLVRDLQLTPWLGTSLLGVLATGQGPPPTYSQALGPQDLLDSSYCLPGGTS